MFAHLEDIGLGYFEHAKGALDGARVSLCASLMLVAHAIYPDILKDDATEMLKEKIRELKSMKNNSTQTDSICLDIDFENEEN